MAAEKSLQIVFFIKFCSYFGYFGYGVFTMAVANTKGNFKLPISTGELERGLQLISKNLDVGEFWEGDVEELEQKVKGWRQHARSLGETIEEFRDQFYEGRLPDNEDTWEREEEIDEMEEELDSLWEKVLKYTEIVQRSKLGDVENTQIAFKDLVTFANEFHKSWDGGQNLRGLNKLMKRVGLPTFSFGGIYVGDLVVSVVGTMKFNFMMFLKTKDPDVHAVFVFEVERSEYDLSTIRFSVENGVSVDHHVEEGREWEGTGYSELKEWPKPQIFEKLFRSVLYENGLI